VVDRHGRCRSTNADYGCGRRVGGSHAQSDTDPDPDPDTDPDSDTDPDADTDADPDTDTDTDSERRPTARLRVTAGESPHLRPGVGLPELPGQ
jgi:hypothetical protein